MKMTKNLTHIASSVEFEPAMTEEQLEAVFAQNDVAGFPAELDIAERTESMCRWCRWRSSSPLQGVRGSPPSPTT